MLFGCVVDPLLPGLANEVPNDRMGTVSPGGAGTGTGGGTTSKNVCECAAAFPAAQTGTACNKCATDALAATQTCGNQNTACVVDPGCQTAIQCIAKCSGDPICVTACVSSADQVYSALIDCMCNACASKCAPPQAIPCDLDGGADAAADG